MAAPELVPLRPRSGHVAFATALERDLGWKYAVPAYIFASYVAISRLPANRHWFSDAVFGASVGIMAGRTVTSREAHPFPVAVVSVPGGAAVMYISSKEVSSGAIPGEYVLNDLDSDVADQHRIGMRVLDTGLRVQSRGSQEPA